MRIAMIGQKGIPAQYGGVERHVHDLSIALSEQNQEVSVYTRSWYSKETSVSNVSVITTASLNTKHLDTITHTFSSTLHALFQNYDIIHYHGVGPALLSWIPRLFSPKTTVVTTFHSIDRYHQKWNAFARFMLRLGERAACTFAHETITISRSLQQYCLNEYTKETTYIPNGVALHRSKHTSDTIKPWGLSKNGYFVMVSRLVPHKGAHLLIEAFKRLKTKYGAQMKDLKLAIVGGSAQTDEYVTQLHKMGLYHRDIIFTGFQSGRALEELYANALALVHPSLNEGLPLTVLQAMSHKRPVLLSNIPEHRELLKNQSIFFTENSVSDLERALEQFMNLSAQKKNGLGAHNKKVVEKNFNWDYLVHDTIAVYERARDTRLVAKFRFA